MKTPLYHPDARFLNDYSAGTLDLGIAITVKAHLEFCPECRQQVQQIEQVGAFLFENPEPQHSETPDNDSAVNKKLLQNILQAIDNSTEQTPADSIQSRQTPKRAHNPGLPPVIEKLLQQPLGNLDWRNIGRKLKFSRIKTGDKKNELGLYYIKAGGKVPKHKHHCDEITVVLKGSFSDEDGIYKKGDFVVRTLGEKHSLMATQDEDCLCLSTVEKPIAFTGFYRMLNPLLKVHAQ